MKSTFIFLFTITVYSLTAQNVGVNNLDPQTSLDIEGALRLRPVGLEISGNQITLPANTGNFYIAGSPAGDFTINESGQELNGQILVLTNQTGNRGFIYDYVIKPGQTMIFIRNDDGFIPLEGQAGWKLEGNYNTNPAIDFLGTNDPKDLIFKTNNQERMRLTSDGKLGVGTINPSTWFELTNNIGSQLARFNGGNNMWVTFAENGLNRGYIGSYGGNAEDVDFGTYGGNSTGKLHFATNGLNRLSIDANGNVGIGELPSAGNRLTVSGGDLAVKRMGDVSRIQLDSDQSDAIDFFKSGVHKHKIQSYGTSLEITRVGAFTADLKLDNDGNFGVGATLVDPVSKLQVYATTDASYTNHGLMVLGNETLANVVYDQNEILARNDGAAADLFLQRDGGNLLLCGEEQGAVGIGLTAGSSIPVGSLLAVDGKITCEEVLVKLSENWPDYVFAKDYPLPPLSEVKSFIDEHQHLPGIPNAATIQDEGFELGEMQRKMMQKIEELTLYIIRLEEKVQRLELKSKE